MHSKKNIHKYVPRRLTFSGYPKQTIAEAQISSLQATIQLTLETNGQLHFMKSKQKLICQY